MNLKFQVKERVVLPEDIVKNMGGTIIGIWICEMGIQYKVRYFWQGKAEEIYFYEQELKKVPYEVTNE
jgi:hypothetical protein